MLKFFGTQPPNLLTILQPGGYCPHCKTGTRFKLNTKPDCPALRSDQVTEFVVNYSCEICLKPIPIRWNIRNWQDGNNPTVGGPNVALPMRSEFNFDYVPENIKKEIEEALDCLSVDAHNGFAAVSRRVVQEICTDLGAQASSKVKYQIEEMAQITNMDDDVKELAFQIMLSGHDGSHPHLPEMNQERSEILLSLLGDLTYELYTRPGKIREASLARKAVIEKKNNA